MQFTCQLSILVLNARVACVPGWDMKILRDAKVIHFSQLFDLVGLPLPPFGIFGEMPRKVIAIFGIAAATGLLIRTRQQESLKIPRTIKNIQVLWQESRDSDIAHLLRQTGSRDEMNRIWKRLFTDVHRCSQSLSQHRWRNRSGFVDQALAFPRFPGQKHVTIRAGVYSGRQISELVVHKPHV